jgi:CheY-like chemotaxis protein
MGSALATKRRPRSTVVIADDDPDVRMILSERFEAEGYDVRVASHGAEAIALLQEIPPPAAVLVDLMMPGIVGHSVLDFIRSEPRFAATSVAIISGSPELAPAGYEVFTKPVRFAKLLEFVQRAPRP